jgi:hypothetical protein
MRGEAPYQIEFRWVYAPPMPFGLDAEARQALVRRRIDEMLKADYGLANGVVRGPDILGPRRDRKAVKRRKRL